MAISHTATGTRVGGTGALTPAYPAGISAGRLALLFACVKPSTATLTTPTGFTLLRSATGGTGSLGVDTGPQNIYAFYRILVGTESGTVTCTFAGQNTEVAHIAIYQNATGLWDLASTRGNDATHGTGRSQAADGTTMAVTVADMIVTFVGSDTDNAAAFTSPAITEATLTFGATTQRMAPGGTTAGNDCGSYAADALVTVGTDAVAEPLFAATCTASSCGPSINVRLREVAAGAVPPTVPVMAPRLPA